MSRLNGEEFVEENQNSTENNNWLGNGQNNNQPGNGQDMWQQPQNPFPQQPLKKKKKTLSIIIGVIVGILCVMVSNYINEPKTGADKLDSSMRKTAFYDAMREVDVRDGYSVIFESNQGTIKRTMKSYNEKPFVGKARNEASSGDIVFEDRLIISQKDKSYIYDNYKKEYCIKKFAAIECDFIGAIGSGKYKGVSSETIDGVLYTVETFYIKNVGDIKTYTADNKWGYLMYSGILWKVSFIGKETFEKELFEEPTGYKRVDDVKDIFSNIGNKFKYASDKLDESMAELELYKALSKIDIENGYGLHLATKEKDGFKTEMKNYTSADGSKGVSKTTNYYFGNEYIHATTYFADETTYIGIDEVKAYCRLEKFVALETDILLGMGTSKFVSAKEEIIDGVVYTVEEFSGAVGEARVYIADGELKYIYILDALYEVSFVSGDKIPTDAFDFPTGYKEVSQNELTKLFEDYMENGETDSKI